MKKEGFMGCFCSKGGFTLIELLVVVLIIGILAAVALPQYQKAVLKSRYASLMPITKSIANGNEAYYIEHGTYANNPAKLDVAGKEEYPSGTQLSLSTDQEHAYVLAHRTDVPNNNYIVYQQRSENYPGEIHCEALKGNKPAEDLCKSLSNADPIGTVITSGYTTYIISGSGAGFPPGYNVLLELADCSQADALGLTCQYNIDEENHTATKKVCIPQKGYCRTRTYNEDGSYTSLTCRVDNQGVCQSYQSMSTYDGKGNLLSTRGCITVTEDGTQCATYNNVSAKNYTYDTNGNKLTERTCDQVAADGTCDVYASYGNYNYTYDTNGNLIKQQYCRTATKGGGCESSGSDYTFYTYKDNLIEMRTCNFLNSAGTGCSYYYDNSLYDSILDDNGNVIASRKCNGVMSDGSCRYDDKVRTDNYDYTYDKNGNQTSALHCATLTADGSKCATYRTTGSYSNRFYTYDNNGNMLTARTCETLKQDGSGCVTYRTGSYSHDYTYDANGRKLSDRTCDSVDENGNCGNYSLVVYTYDDKGKEVVSGSCSGQYITTNPDGCTWNNVHTDVYNR